MTLTRIVICCACAVLVTDGYRPYPDPGEDIAGHRYCGKRSPSPCCQGRDDRCTVPILDTLCYCDMFCNRTVADCCPDFWPLCLDSEPPQGALEFPAKTNTVKSKWSLLCLCVVYVNALCGSKASSINVVISYVLWVKLGLCCNYYVYSYTSFQ